MKNKVKLKFSMRNGETIECYSISEHTDASKIFLELFPNAVPDGAQDWIRFPTIQDPVNGSVFVLMNDVCAVEMLF